MARSDTSSSGKTAALDGALAARLQQAMAQHRAGHLAKAEAAYRHILGIAPDHADALHLLGLLAFQQGRAPEALELVDRAIGRNRRIARYHNTRGLALNAGNRLMEAAQAFRDALKLDPGHVDALLNLGGLLRRQGDPAGAAELFQRALRQRAESVEALIGLGSALCEAGRFADALPPLAQAQKLRPDDPGLLVLLGNALAVLRRPAAPGCFEQALKLKPDFVPALAGLGDWNRRGSRPERAVAYLERAAALEPDPRRDAALADALIAAGSFDAAETRLRALAADHPDSVSGHLLLARLLRVRGRFDESLASLDRAAALHPDSPEVLTALAEHHGAQLPAAVFDRLRAAVDRPGPANRLAPARFALAQVLDARDETEAAFAEFARANQIWREALAQSGRVYDPARQEHDIDRLIAVFTPGFFAKAAGSGVDSDLPVFITGMPRSGTTLVEQILAGHSKVHAAGELKLVAEIAAALPTELGADTPLYPECLERLSDDSLKRHADAHVTRLAELAQAAGRPAARRVVDKQPLNFLHLGLIVILWPRATLVHCRRDPRDTLLSCFSQSFETSYAWAWDLASLAHFYRQYDRLMAHWRAVLPVPMLEVGYEALVDDLDGGARRLVAHAGLDWQDACAAFHLTDRPVTTASLFQVRRPIYRSSVGRWRRYERHLAPLLAGLGDLAEA